MKSLIAILSVAIILFFCAADLFAQEKKDDKRWEISGYFGIGGSSSLDRPFYFNTHCLGLGLEYFLTHRISVEGAINYLPNIAYASPPQDGRPWGESIVTYTGEDEKYRLLCDINFLFYFDITKIKKPNMRWFLTVGVGYQYDREESTYVSLTTQEQYKYEYGEFHSQLTFGVGYNINITGDWALKLLYKIHMPYADVITPRLALGLTYRF